ncbi:MAG TPA: HD domain-containing phosphohydrolase [Candidatus Brocadiaceae bacterium]
MIIPIRVLIIEDSEDDAMLVLRELKRGGYEPIHKRVDTPEALKVALKSQTWDIILSDYSMPNFTGLDALLLLRETGLDIPFVLMSGTVGEESAAEIMKAGAHDFIIKGHLSRLTEIVSREMRDAHNRRQQKLAEDELMASEERFRVITESASDAIIGLAEPGRICLWNKKAEEMFGYSARETEDKELHIFIVPERYREKALQGLKTFFQTGTGPVIGKTLELFAVRKDGTEFPVEISISAVNVRGAWEATGIIRDIAERKKASEKLREEMETTSALLKITEATAYTIDIDKLMEQVVIVGSKIVKCGICLSYLWDDETETFQPNQSHGLPHEVIPLFRTYSLDAKTGFIREALEKKQPVIISDFGLRNGELKFASPNSTSQTKDSTTQNFHAEVFQWINDIITMIIIPLAGKNNYLGVIVGIGICGDPLQCVSTKFTERDINIFNAISSQVSIALEQARLYKESFERAIELSHKIETIKVMNEIDRSILSTVDSHSQTVLETVTRLVGSVIPCDHAMITLIDKERQGLIYTAGFGTSSLAKGAFISFKDTSTTEVAENGHPQYEANLTAVKNLLPLEKRLLAEGFLSHIRIPLIVRGETIGVLNIGAKRASAFTPENFSTLEKLTTQIGVALENARLFTDLEELFLGTVKSLSSAMDANSRWAAGHSERVTKYSVALGKELGLSTKELRHLELAAILHDIGKIGTYETILDKQRRLTDEEIRLSRQHPLKGVEILASIKQLKEVIPAVRHHHESYDGKGYPDGLKGEAIPLFARIIGIADAVDAMSSDRPYRKRRPMSEIIDELKRCSGMQFDPKIVDIFLKALQKTGISP